MTELWMPVAFAAVIVLGIVSAQVWQTLLTKVLPPMAKALLERELAKDEAIRRSGMTPDRIPEIDRRIEYLEERVRFLEALLEPRDSSESTQRLPI